MNFKRILSTALTLVMIFMAVVAVIPFGTIKSDAAYSPSTSNAAVGDASLNADELLKYLKTDYYKNSYTNAEDMLEYDLARGYLDYTFSDDGNYAIYINRYTGLMFYKNNITGQLLTSNPTDVNEKGNYRGSLTATVPASFYDAMSQVHVVFYEVADPTAVYNYNSAERANPYGQITVTAIDGGLRVNYTLGDTAPRELLPLALTAEDFSNDILKPMLENLQALVDEECQDPDGKIKKTYPVFFDNADYDSTVGGEKNYYISEGYLLNYLKDLENWYKTYYKNRYYPDAPAYNKTDLSACVSAITTIAALYAIADPVEENALLEQAKKQGETSENYLMQKSVVDNYNKYTPFKNGEVIVIPVASNIQTISQQKKNADYIKRYAPTYTFEMMYEDEDYCGVEAVLKSKPYVRCAIEYTFNDDGSLSVRVPANSISFDQSTYVLESVSILKYFGSGNMTEEGFIFFPDGSGTVVEFDDFYKPEVNKTPNISGAAESIFGIDYCYSSITGAHRQQVTMPVYGLVSTAPVTEATAEVYEAAGLVAPTTMKTGYFAVLEEGASLAKLNFFSNGKANKFVNVYASYSPYPKDEYDLTSTISVGNALSYTMVAKTKYSGYYVTRITMLQDDNLGSITYGAGNYANTTYIGMASYYRNYLEDTGVIELMSSVEEDLPLYIEALGSMTIMTKVLTFPVEEEIPLTTFDDVITIYNEFAKARTRITQLKAEAEKNFAETDNELLKDEYRANIAKYEQLLEKVEGITNINFRLTGFANDGMYYTYPSKVEWDDVVGGDEGFANLISESNKVSANAGQNFGVYPEFDFLYITNTAAFDGVSQSSDGAKMVDNRYASKQVYNAILQEFETFYTMVVSSARLDDLYTEFNEDYSKYGAKGLSVSTLGSDLNSNFDEDDPINRDEAREDIVALLARMHDEDGYELMMDKGNIYSVKYATHLLNVTIDSSNFKYSSYTVPFVGMILHGYVNYAGSPLNYSGSTKYEILRAIESGAAPYYILCYQNSSHMKEDEQLNKYYGVDYETWYDDILLTYNELNSQIGDLQDYKILGHQTVISERVREDSEKLANYKKLEDEYFALLGEYVDSLINEKFDELKAEGNITAAVKVTFSEGLITSQFRGITADAGVHFEEESFAATLRKFVDKYMAEYPGDTSNHKNDVEIKVAKNMEYTSAYSFYTFSDCDDENYVSTAYTLDNHKTVIVTYVKGDDVVRFILNYNIYDVEVRLDGKLYTLDKYGYVRID